MGEQKFFGTDGVRGRAGEFPLNAGTLIAIGQAIGERLQGRVLIGQDTRISSPWILDLLGQGFQRTSAELQDAGIIPTPAIALLTRSHPFAGGVMISASHNPFEDNGIKVFSSDGTKLKDEDESGIERRISELLPPEAAEQTSTIPGQFAFNPNETRWPADYKQHLLSHFRPEPWLKGVRIVVDCANGAMSEVAPSLLKQLGAEVQVLFAAPDGRNINEGCGAVHLGALTEAMKQTTADFGVAFDGDGDRSLFVSSSGRQIDGDAVLLVMARRNKPQVVVGTSMTNFALEKMLNSEGIQLTRVGVGDRYIFEEMQRSKDRGETIGGEPSGHVIFSDFGLSGDGLLTTLKVAEAMVDSGRSLDELTRDWVAAPQLLKGVRVRSRIPLDSLPTLQTTMGAAHEALQGRGRLVIRYSGTEPLLRVMIESDDARRNEEWMARLLAAIENDFANR